MRRTLTTGLLPLVLLAPAAISGWLGCHAIAGIEDRTYVPPEEEPEPSPVSEACASYCADVMENCTGENQVYSTLDTCHGVCAALPAGDPLEPVDNTLACRARQAELAGLTGEPAVHCPAAGPGGAPHCGTNCESYCALQAAACSPELPTQEECVAKCAGLRDVEGFDAIENHEGDTLQCRLVHVSSATVDPDEHCEHASLMPVEPCIEPEGTEPSCEDFCRVVMTSCEGDQAVYDSSEQCLAVCGALPPGGTEDRSENTVGCRQYHAYSALLAPDTHCGHAGPGGDGHCGLDGDSTTTGNCASYCTLLEAACKEAFDAIFEDRGACELDCGDVSGAGHDSGYAIASAEGATVACRLLYVSRAFEDPTLCAAALGDPPCQ
ncbi:hypothetical protein [Sorangium cellulosum]|uniref:Uncharacterized protein n=1 Tax=Sorangium cellulosum So0157-2 TaxID=1254432 RepID=S4XWT9_SORCE|nr:hypothetical protein [Sorangium cellulosum]AGP35048.1 hypothetical protein SCE1572_11330 [Sorangium cellulosum So0157-2]